MHFDFRNQKFLGSRYEILSSFFVWVSTFSYSWVLFGSLTCQHGMEYLQGVHDGVDFNPGVQTLLGRCFPSNTTYSRRHCIAILNIRSLLMMSVHLSVDLIIYHTSDGSIPSILPSCVLPGIGSALPLPYNDRSRRTSFTSDSIWMWYSSTIGSLSLNFVSFTLQVPVSLRTGPYRTAFWLYSYHPPNPPRQVHLSTPIPQFILTVGR